MSWWGPRRVHHQARRTTWSRQSERKTISRPSVKSFIQLEHDAIAAYETCIDRLEAPNRKEKVREFLGDHRAPSARTRGSRAGGRGLRPRRRRHEGGWLTTSKVKLAGMTGGDGAVAEGDEQQRDRYRHRLGPRQRKQRRRTCAPGGVFPACARRTNVATRNGWRPRRRRPEPCPLVEVTCQTCRRAFPTARRTFFLPPSDRPMIAGWMVGKIEYFNEMYDGGTVRAPYAGARGVDAADAARVAQSQAVPKRRSCFAGSA